MTTRRGVAALSAVLCGVALFGCAAGSDGGEGVGQGGGDVIAASTLVETSDGPTSVGGSDESGGFLFTVHQVLDPWTPAQQFVTPAAGMRFVAFELSAVNEGGEAETFSSLLGAEVTDSQNRVWQSSFTMLDPSMAGIDGELQPGVTRRGWFAAEVPVDAQLATLRLRGNLTSAGAVWLLG